MTAPVAAERVLGPAELAVVLRRRRLLAAETSGRVLELGGGLGEHLDEYRDASAVTIVGPDRVARRALQRRGAAAAVPVTVEDRSVVEARLAPASFEFAVSCLALCSVEDLIGTLEAVRRALTPTGRLLFVEPTAAAGARQAVGALLGRTWLPRPWRDFAGRDIPGAVRRAGFTVVDLERFTMPTFLLPLRSCVAGRARPALAGHGDGR